MKFADAEKLKVLDYIEFQLRYTEREVLSGHEYLMQKVKFVRGVIVCGPSKMAFTEMNNGKREGRIPPKCVFAVLHRTTPESSDTTMSYIDHLSIYKKLGMNDWIENVAMKKETA
jgi:hypothetical protein